MIVNHSFSSVHPPAKSLTFGGFLNRMKENKKALQALKVDIHAQIKDQYDKIPTVKEKCVSEPYRYINEEGKEVNTSRVWIKTNKRERADIFLQLLRQLPRAKNMKEAYNQVYFLLLAIETVAHDKTFRPSKEKEESLKTLFKPLRDDSTMLMPALSKIKGVKELKAIYANGHTLYLGINGAIQVQLRNKKHQIILDKSGVDSRSIQISRAEAETRYGLYNKQEINPFAQTA